MTPTSAEDSLNVTFFFVSFGEESMDKTAVHFCSFGQDAACEVPFRFKGAMDLP